jgi:hypothetical protein
MRWVERSWAALAWTAAIVLTIWLIYAKREDSPWRQARAPVPVEELAGERAHEDKAAPAVAEPEPALPKAAPAQPAPQRAALPTDLPPLAPSAGQPSPYTFIARRGDGALLLAGQVPDVAARAAIRNLINERFFGERIIDELRQASGAPKNYLAAVSFGLRQLSLLASGELVVADATMRLDGEALYEQTAEQTMQSVATVALPGWTGSAEVKSRPSARTKAAH